MTSKSETGCGLSNKANGFVVAMRARLINSARPTCHEWVIVSRWGPDGGHLSIGWTSQLALTGQAPINLTPSRTSLAICAKQTPADAPATFVLAPVLPSEITVVGDFAPAEGHVRLYGSGAKLRVRLRGLCLSCPIHSTWQVDATRAEWLGEFIEPDPGTGA